MDAIDYIPLLRETVCRDYTQMFREPGGALTHPFLVPGSAQYAEELWDWDAWLTNVALRQILLEVDDPAASAAALAYERGCVLNFLEGVQWHGYVPITISRKGFELPPDIYSSNMHKPCLAQHAAFLVQQEDGDAEWLRDHFFGIQAFLNNYRSHHRHSTGLYFWQTDACIGGDNDPCTYGRPPRSSGSIFLNCMMYKELLAAEYLAKQLGLLEVAARLSQDASQLQQAVQTHCWDEWTGFYYSVDLNLTDAPPHASWGNGFHLHSGSPRDWSCLIQRIGVWSGFLALWSGIATGEQAARIVSEHCLNERTFACNAGIRTLSKLEKMYSIRASGNPSSWLGPVWGVSNYLTFRGLVRHGHLEAARDLCDKTIRLFGRDVDRFGAMHEYYQPDGEPILNRGFQNWNYLVLNMIAWREDRAVIGEF